MSKREAPSGQNQQEAREALYEMRQEVARELFLRYDRARTLADAHATVPEGMAHLARAEAILDRIKRLKVQTTQAEMEALLKESGIDVMAIAREQSRLTRELRGLDIVYNPITPEITQEQLDVIREVFGAGNLEPLILPRADQFDDAYRNAFYPAGETPDDTRRDLTNHHPSYWSQDAERVFQQRGRETWGEVFTHALRQGLAFLQPSASNENAILLIETIAKPNFSSDGRYYGTKEGLDDSRDPLLPLIRDVFGAEAKRFNHTHNQLSERLLPRVQTRIQQRLEARGLTMPKISVILAPAVSFNTATVLRHPELSRTDTWEWSNDILPDGQDGDSGHRLGVGSSDHGGAGHVCYDHRDVRSDYGGFRLAVVLDR